MFFYGIINVSKAIKVKDYLQVDVKGTYKNLIKGVALYTTSTNL